VPNKNDVLHITLFNASLEVKIILHLVFIIPEYLDIFNKNIKVVEQIFIRSTIKVDNTEKTLM